MVGWTDPEGTRPFLGALLLAYYDPDGRLIYAGRAGNNAVNYFITTAGHSSFEAETDTRLRTIMNELPPMAPP